MSGVSIVSAGIGKKSFADQFAFSGYSELQECREVVDDCLSGQKTIKSKEKYLPPNKWQEAHRQEYTAFLRRALFPGETDYSMKIYNGLFTLGTPNVTLPEDGRLDYLMNDADVYGGGLKNIQCRLNEEQMTHGLRCMLLDVRESDETPFSVREYCASRFLRSHFKEEGGESYADFIILDDSHSEFDMKTFSDVFVPSLLVLAIDAYGSYYQRSVSPEELSGGKLDVLFPPDDGRTIYPAIQGRRFTRIPFVWCGATSISGSRFDNPPILSIAQTELKLYMSLAYHSQHIYMNTQEFLVFTGVGKDFDVNKVCVGAGAGIAIDKADAKAFYVSTNGVGFQAEKDEISMLQEEIDKKRMSLMSAKTHQSGTVVGLLQNSQSAPLRDIVATSGEAITKILRFAAEWLGYGTEEIYRIKYIPSEQFADPRVNLSEFIALCRAVYDGEVQMLEEDLFTMARESGYIRNGMTWKEFREKYEIESDRRRRENSVLPFSQGNPFANDVLTN